jgi:AraC family transcriptional regulator, positive regulator of tynA and feaB
MKIEEFSRGRDEGSVSQDSFQKDLNRSLSIRFRIEPTGNEPFAFRMTTFVAKRLRCADIRFSSHKTSLLPGILQRGQESSFLLSVQPEGETLVRQSGREASVMPGDFFLIDTRQPFYIETTDVHTRSVYIPNSCLREALPEVDLCTAIAVASDSGGGRVVRAVVDELFNLAPDLDNDAADRFANLLPHVLGVAFAAHLRCPSSTSSRLEIIHRETIRKFARQNLHDSKMDPGTIAKGVGLSRRYVHELFEKEPETLMRWIWAERLMRVRRDLSNPMLRRTPIASIAYDWGFNNPAHFSRCFKAVFATSPRQFRKNRLSSLEFPSLSSGNSEP